MGLSSYAINLLFAMAASLDFHASSGLNRFSCVDRFSVVSLFKAKHFQIYIDFPK